MIASIFFIAAPHYGLRWGAMAPTPTGAPWPLGNPWMMLLGPWISGRLDREGGGERCGGRPRSHAPDELTTTDLAAKHDTLDGLIQQCRVAASSRHAIPRT
jgi:hypothetical protein